MLVPTEHLWSGKMYRLPYLLSCYLHARLFYETLSVTSCHTLALLLRLLRSDAKESVVALLVDGIFVGFEENIFKIPSKPLVAFYDVREANKWKYEEGGSELEPKRDFVFIPLR